MENKIVMALNELTDMIGKVGLFMSIGFLAIVITLIGYLWRK